MKSKACAPLVEWQGESLVHHRLLIEQQSKQLASLRSDLREALSRFESNEHSSEESLRRIEHHRQQLEDLGHDVHVVKESTGRARQLAEILWSSLAWRGYSKLARGLLSISPRRASRSQYRTMRGQVHQAIDQLSSQLSRAEIGFDKVENPEVSVVVPYFDRPDQLVRCLRALRESGDQSSLEVIAVGHGPKEPFRSALKQVSNLRTYRSSGAEGSTGALNTGIKKARGRRVLLLDPSVTITGRTIDRLCAAMDRRPDAGAVGGALLDGQGTLLEAGGILYRDGKIQRFGHGLSPLEPACSYARPADFCSDVCLLVDRQALEQANRLPTDLDFGLVRSAGLALRLRQRGLRTYYEPSVKVAWSPGDRTRTIRDAKPDALEALISGGSSEIFETLAAVEASADQAKDGRVVRRVAVIDHRLPTPDQDAGSVRSIELLAALRRIGYQVTFVPANLLRLDDYAQPLQDLGVEVLAQPCVGDLFEHFKEHGDRYELVVVSRFHIAKDMTETLRKLVPDAKFVFDTVDLQFLRTQREAELVDDQDLLDKAEEVKLAELALADSVDATIVVSSTEQQLLQSIAPELDVHLVSLIQEVSTAEAAGFDERRGAYFVGGFEHPPNADAVVWFVGEVMPLIRQRIPGFELSIIGSKATPEVQKLAAPDVHILGHVQDLAPFLSGCRLSIAPLRFGAGIKGKVLQSLAAGLPCVMTTIAAEGIGLENEVNALLADEPEAFADHVVRVYRDAELWSELSTRGRQTLQERFSTATAERALEKMLASLGLPWP